MSTSEAERPRVPILWGDPYSLNLGVQALGLSIASGLGRRGCTPYLGCDRLSAPTEETIGGVQFVGFPAVYSKKPWAPGNIRRSLVLGRCGLGWLDPLSRLMRGAASLDVSGGDSFATIYGPRRFAAMSATKELALRVGAPLILMPQTFGPYDDPESRATMERLVRGASQAWARDRKSHELLLGIRPDAGLSADVAFTLPYDVPDASLPRDDGPIGFNLSGLVSRGPAHGSFGISLDTAREFESMLVALSAESGGRPLLPVVHVHGAPGDRDSDAEAQREIRDRLIARGIEVLPVFSPKSAVEAKSRIARCSFFVGIRMHACIAALSSRTPAVGLAYSLKTGPVFETVGAGDAVIELRTARPGEIATRTVEWYRRRDELRTTLVQSVPKAIASVETMFDAAVKSLPPAGR
jgi:polysaccharide pyruvyl transferase WcaK-like protein